MSEKEESVKWWTKTKNWHSTHLSKSDIYIFDEATSALDNDTEKLVMNSIEKINKTQQ